jgi:hypothetical protein
VDKVADFTDDPVVDPTTAAPAIGVSQPKTLDDRREEARGDLARGLLWLLTFAVGGVMAFVGLGKIEGSVMSQSIFPSLVALAGTALGFYFGSGKASGDSGGGGGTATSPPKVTWIPDAGAGGGANGGGGNGGVGNSNGGAGGGANGGAAGEGNGGTGGAEKAAQGEQANGAVANGQAGEVNDKASGPPK